MRTIQKAINLVDRNLKCLINKNYKKNKLKKRSGNCKKCGQCCKECEHLNKTTKLCKVYDKRPFLCYKEFPISAYEQRLWNVKDCGYKF